MASGLRVALVVSHPIQHFCPQYESFARCSEIVFKVFFGSALGYKKYFDPAFGQEISWGNINLEKFDHQFMNDGAVIQSMPDLDAPELPDALDAFAPDVVITYGYFQKVQRRAKEWALTNRVKLAYISDSEMSQKRHRLKELVKYFLVKKYFSKIDYFLFVGQANFQYYTKHGVRKDQLIEMHFPIDVNQYSNSLVQRSLLRSKIRQRYALGADDKVLAVVGKLSPWKNQNHIISAMSMLEQEGIVMTLLMIGSGEMKESWQAEAASLTRSKVHFTGFVNIEELPGYYAAADLYVHPASVEPHSIAISEAIFMGCPVILSDRCGSYGLGDDVEDGVNGYVYNFGNIRQLADKIKQITGNPSLAEKFGIESHRRAQRYQQRAHEGAIKDLASRVTARKLS
jgi:glycosyltransferase involved in cell wall biosynthesis